MKKIITYQELQKHQSISEYACIKNPAGIFPKMDFVPLAEKRMYVNQLDTIVCDMDGTTTTTENLCIHSLEFMLRKISGLMELSMWAGLDKDQDYPNIIGNSTTRHIEYLIDNYYVMINEHEIRKSFIEAAIWVFRYGKDPQRLKEVQNSCAIMGCGNLYRQLDKPDDAIINTYLSQCHIDTKSKMIRASIDIYYQRYHEILKAIDEQKSIPQIELIQDISIDALIKPMPAVAIFICLVKGWLTANELQCLIPELHALYVQKTGHKYGTKDKDISELANYFRKKPAKLALVTSSIFYEADIVIKQVFLSIQKEIAKWPLSEKTKKILVYNFSNYHSVYNTFVTASNSHEIRLKPHRDLYSIALQNLNISSDEMDKVIGFEDSESGTIAIRAAGISCAIALPFAETAGHDLSAASYIVEGGLPEVILTHECFIEKKEI